MYRHSIAHVQPPVNARGPGLAGTLSHPKRLQRVARVRNEHGAPCRRFQERETRDALGRQEPAFERRHRYEMSLTVAFQPKAVTGIGRGCIRLHLHHIAGDDQVERAVAIDVARGDAADR